MSNLQGTSLEATSGDNGRLGRARLEARSPTSALLPIIAERDAIQNDHDASPVPARKRDTDEPWAREDEGRRCSQ